MDMCFKAEKERVRSENARVAKANDERFRKALAAERGETQV